MTFAVADRHSRPIRKTAWLGAAVAGVDGEAGDRGSPSPGADGLWLLCEKTPIGNGPTRPHITPHTPQPAPPASRAPHPAPPRAPHPRVTPQPASRIPHPAHPTPAAGGSPHRGSPKRACGALARYPVLISRIATRSCRLTRPRAPPAASGAVHLVGSPIRLWVLYPHASAEPTSGWVNPADGEAGVG